MLKRILVLAVLSLAVAAPAALADSGAPSAPALHAPAAGVSSASAPKQAARSVRKRIRRVTVAFARHCTSQHADAQRCVTAARRLLTGLQRIDGRIADVVAKIQQRCSGSGGQAVPKLCAHADQLVQRLGGVESRIEQVVQKLQDWLDHASTSTGAGPSAGGSSSGSPTSGSSGLESLDQLAADLTNLRAAANG